MAEYARGNMTAAASTTGSGPDVLNQDESCSAAGVSRRPLSDSSIKYEENAFQDSSDVILVHFSERRNSSSSPGNSDGDYTSDEIDEPASSSSSINAASARISYPTASSAEKSFGVGSRNGHAKCAFVCDCQQSRKSKRKVASKLVNVSSAAFPVPVSVPRSSMARNGIRSRDSLSFIGKVKRWFGESNSPTHFEVSDPPRWPKTVGSSTKLLKGNEIVSMTHASRSCIKKDLPKKEGRFLIPDMLALTNCSYYWGKINRHEAEELLNGKPDGTFLLRDSAHKDHLFSVSFRRYDKTLHARVEQWDHKYSFDRESPTAFYSMTIKGLLDHYSIGEYCMFFEPMLLKPLYRTQPQPLMSLCRGVIASQTNYDDVDELPIPRTLKNYLFEYNYCIKPKSKKDDPGGRRKRNSTLCLL